MIPAAPKRGDCAMVDRYEALRAHVLGSEVCGHSVRGLALLMRSGMAVWMDSANEPTRDAPIETAPRPMAMPQGLERNLIEIVANMAFSAAMENVI